MRRNNVIALFVIASFSGCASLTQGWLTATNPPPAPELVTPPEDPVTLQERKAFLFFQAMGKDNTTANLCAILFGPKRAIEKTEDWMVEGFKKVCLIPE